MYTASDLRKGLRIEIDGVPYLITEFQFVKPGKGQALYNCKLKNLVTGATLSKTYRSNDRMDEPQLDEKTLRFSYVDGPHYVFLDKNYEQVPIDADVLGDARFYLNEDTEVAVLYHNGRPIDVTLPTFVEKTIVRSEPGARGNTATNVLKSAWIEGDYEIQVPLFVEQGDIVRLDTRTGEYVDRVSKR
ncbi:MAG: elongation factor P [Lentisphaerae bacterium]|nr:elongation factor P [Lentisphaerota bacterium]